MSHPNKRQKLHGQQGQTPISAFSQIRKQGHDAFKDGVRSSTGQGKHMKFASESPEPADISAVATSTPRANNDSEVVNSSKKEVTSEGLTEIEALELRRKNEKARKKLEKEEKREKKRRRKEEKQKSRDETDEGEYSSWHGLDEPSEPEATPRIGRNQKRFVEEAVVVDTTPRGKRPKAATSEVTVSLSTESPDNQSKGKKKRKQKDLSEIFDTPTPTQTNTTNTRGSPQKATMNGENIIPESLKAPMPTPDVGKPVKKIKSIWEKLAPQPKAGQKDADSIGSSGNSVEPHFDTPEMRSETSLITIHSADAISPEPQFTKQKSQLLKPSGGQARVYKNLPAKETSPAQQEVGNDSTAGLVDPSTPTLAKPQVKTKAQVSQELQEVRKSLPVWGFQSEIQSTMLDSDTMVLVGETGSGKSTQIGQFLLKQPWMSRSADPNGKKYGGCIAITQPRRVAAISLAQRVSSEMGTHLGKEVGYCVRFDDQSQHDTKIRYITDGMLLNEILRDPELSRYSAVVVDEAHERSVSTDLGMGLLKGIVESRRKKKIPLKLTVMSATLDIEKMSNFIGACPIPESEKDEVPPAPVCMIPGKIYPVDIYYTPTTIDNFQTAAVKTIFQLHYQHPIPGDILVFSTGSEEIEDLASTVEELALQMDADKPKLQVMKLYASLDPAEQQKVFARTNPNARKVIIATNIAETSITVPGVRHVIDCGKVKTKRFRHQLGIESLLVTDISQASALQRKGRAGREAAGTCFRLYPEDCYKKFAKTTEPEILNCDLAGALLTLKARAVDDIFNFPYLDRPSRQSFEKALLTLHTLDALDDQGKITEIGKKMSRFPLPPVQSRVIVAAGEEETASKDEDEDVLVDVIDVLSCLSVDGNIFMQNMRWNKVAEAKKTTDPLLPSKNKRKANEEDSDDDATLEERVHTKRMEVVHPSGDHLTCLNILRRYLHKRPAERKQFCEDYQISSALMKKVVNIRKQLRNYCRLDDVGNLPRDNDMKYESETMVARYPRVSERQTEKILKCFLKGVGVGNVARRISGGKYRTLTASGNSAGGVDVGVHPSSCLMWERNSGSDSKRAKKEKETGTLEKRDEGFGEAVMYQDVVWTSKAFMKCVSKVKLEWVADMWAEG